MEIEQNMAEKDERNGLSKHDDDSNDDNNSAIVEPFTFIRTGLELRKSSQVGRGSIIGPRMLNHLDSM